jgi:hypothetical protein
MFTHRFLNLFVIALLVVVIALFVRELQTKTSNVGVADQSFHTPPMSNYHPVVPTPGWRTPRTSNYTPNNPVGKPGWRTPPMSKYYPPFIPTPGWRTPPTSNYYP